MAACGPGAHPAPNEICLSPEENPDEPSPVLENLPPRLAADGAGRFVPRPGRRTRTECRGEFFHPGRYGPRSGRAGRQWDRAGRAWWRGPDVRADPAACANTATGVGGGVQWIGIRGLDGALEKICRVQRTLIDCLPKH